MKWFCLPVFIFLLSASVFAQGRSYITHEGGITLYPNKKFSGNVESVDITCLGPNIVRVTASPGRNKYTRTSLAVERYPVATPWRTEEGNNIVLSLGQYKVLIDTITAIVSFADSTGKIILSENPGRSITPVVFEGEPLYNIRQVFRLSEDEGVYGLGQHQEDAFNYKGKQVVFFQNNTEVAIPFLISTKNYGILWDNYSYSKAGDIRPFQPLSSLYLFDKNNTQGWLTASYVNDRNKPNEVAFEKAESEIAYTYVNDSKMKLAKEFAVEKGLIRWEGSFSSDVEGAHQLKFTYAGYLKVWIDNKLMLDRWRQAWNPGTGLLELPVTKNKKQSIKIEWTPDGGESYFTVNTLPPAPFQDRNTFSFESEAGQAIDYYFIYGKNMDEVIAGYRQLTGKAPIVPKWAMGFWQSRERYKTQDEILQTVDEFRKRQIPLDNIVLDWSYWKENDWGSQEFDATRFSNPDSMIKVLHDKYKANIMISVWPKFYEGIPAYKKFDEQGWLYKRNIADRQRDWIGQGYISTFYDAFNEKARKGFWDLIHEKLYTKGIDAWWMDASEPDILSNVSPERRKLQMSPTALGTAAEYLNAYPLQNAKGIYEGQRGVDPNKRVFLLTRSGFAGSQRYGTAIWSGDIASRWEDMKAQISAGTNFSMSGLPYWTMDIGGFAVERRYERPNETDLAEWRELMTRWYQFGSFVPLFRAHGQFPFREIYNIAPQGHPAYESMLYYNKLRYRLMPYLYSLAGHAYHNDYTIMRGLVMDFAKDTAVLNIGDQFILGPSLLINPVYRYKATDRSVYLPAGQGWYDLYDGKYYEGGRRVTLNAPYDRTPVLIKEGSVIPTGPAIMYTAEKPANPLIIYVYAGRNGEFSLYEDEGVNYNYEKGQFSQIRFSYDEESGTITIDERKGSFPGMLKSRTFHFKVVSKTNGAGMDFNLSGAKTVKYSGNKTTVKLR